MKELYRTLQSHYRQGIFFVVFLSTLCFPNEMCGMPYSPRDSSENPVTLNRGAKPFSLFLFDVDNVLFRKSDDFFYMSHSEQLKRFDESYEMHISRQTERVPDGFYKECWDKMWLDSREEVVDKSIIEALHQAQEAENTIVIAVTSCDPFMCLSGTYFHRHRENALKRIGVDFMQSLEGGWLTHLGSALGEYPQPQPTYLNGILYTRGFEKGVAVERLLRGLIQSKTIPGMPGNIVFYDDMQENLRSMELFCGRYNILYEPHHVVPCVQVEEAYVCSKVTILRALYGSEPDEDWYKFQITTLFAENVWLGDRFRELILHVEHCKKARAEKKRRMIKKEAEERERQRLLLEEAEEKQALARKARERRQY